jgi:hypothetical protein
MTLPPIRQQSLVSAQDTAYLDLHHMGKRSVLPDKMIHASSFSTHIFGFSIDNGRFFFYFPRHGRSKVFELPASIPLGFEAEAFDVCAFEQVE